MSLQTMKSIFFNPRILAMLCLGFSSGLPLALTGSTLQAWYTEAGISVVTIGALSLIGMPYVWKFLWAPILDSFAPFKAERRRSWIFVTQLGLCLALMLFAMFDPKAEPITMGLIALLIAFLSASQDIAIDAYRTDVLRPDERGVGSATFIFAYRMAMLISGGLTLVIADYFGWRFAYQLMAGLLALSIIGTYFAPPVQETKDLPKNVLGAVIKSFEDLFCRDSIVLLLLFVVFYKLGDALVVSLLSNFLLHGLGFTLTEVGLVYKTVGLIGVILGAFSGGILLVWLGLFRSLLWFGFAQAFSTLAFMVLALAGKNFALMVGAIFIENFCSGMGTAAFMAFLMSLCHKQYTATQYACLSALASIGRVCLGPLAGYMVKDYGWVTFFAWSFILSFPGLLLLGFLRSKVSFNAKMAEV